MYKHTHAHKIASIGEHRHKLKPPAGGIIKGIATVENKQTNKQQFYCRFIFKELKNKIGVLER